MHFLRFNEKKSHKILVVKKIVVILHRKTDENRVLVDVPWCNGSTRVFGSLSHRSNRCGTTSPSRALLLHPRYGRALLPRSVYMTLLFFSLFATFSVDISFFMFFNSIKAISIPKNRYLSIAKTSKHMLTCMRR